jgi:uncharacterized protein involved in exopolysaccharide biosynthesis
MNSASAASNVAPFRPAHLLPWAAAAALAVTAIWLGQSLLSARQELAALRIQVQLTDIARREAENRLKAERITLNRQIADLADRLAARNPGANP